MLKQRKRNKDTTIQQNNYLGIQQRNKTRKHEQNAILQAQLRAHQQAYLSQPVYLKKIVWSVVRLLSLSESYYPPTVTTPGET